MKKESQYSTPARLWGNKHSYTLMLQKFLIYLKDIYVSVYIYIYPYTHTRTRLFTAELFVIAKDWELKCASIEAWLNKQWFSSIP